MTPNVIGLAVGTLLGLAILFVPLRNYKQTWWGGFAFAVIFFTAGPAIANAIHRRASLGEYWQEIGVVTVAIIVAILGTRRR